MVDFIGEKGQSEPYLLISGSLQNPQQAFVVVDQEVLCEIELADCAFALISVFFVFNICYTKNLTCVFTFLEIALLNLSPKVPPTVNNFLSVLNVNT